MATISLIAGSNGRQYPDVQAAWAAIPTDVVASGNSYDIFALDDSEFVLNDEINLSGKNTDAGHQIRLIGNFTDKPNIDAGPYRYSASAGTAFRRNGGTVFNINQDWLTIYGIQVMREGGGDQGAVTLIGNNTYIIGSIVEAKNSNPFANAITLGGSARLWSTLVVVWGAETGGLYSISNACKVENCTIANLSESANHPGLNGSVDNYSVKNTAVFGFASVGGSQNISGSNNATDRASVPFGTNNKAGLVFASQFENIVSGTHDFRLKAGSALIDAGATPEAAHTAAPNGVRQQGTAADIGAWEVTSAIKAPTVTITSITVTGQTVVVSGTTTNSPTSGTISLALAGVPYNSGVAQGPIDLTLGTNTFTATFTGVKVGAYVASPTVANSSFSATTTGNVNVTGALATSVVQDPMAGQILTIHGTTSGSPVSGTLIVPAATVNPDGAISQTADVQLGQGTFTVSATLPAGNFDAGILRFTTAAGTSLPQPGTSAVTISGFDGNPDAPAIDALPGEEVPPTEETPTGPTVFVSWAVFDTLASPIQVDPPPPAPPRAHVRMIPLNRFKIRSST